MDVFKEYPFFDMLNYSFNSVFLDQNQKILRGDDPEDQFHPG